MFEYIGLLSDIHNIKNKNQDDVDSYLDIARTYKGHILELGSGSGNLSIGLARYGYKVTCLEIHRDMISLHKSKLSSKNSEAIDIVLGDMRSIKLNKKFDLILAASDVVTHLKSAESFLKMLTSVKNHLSDDGVFVIECKQPLKHQMNSINGIEVVSKYTNPKTKNIILEKKTKFYNYVNQIERTHIIATEYENEIIKRRVDTMCERKIWYSHNIRSFIKQSGLSILIESGQLSEIVPLKEDSNDMIFYIKNR